MKQIARDKSRGNKLANEMAIKLHMFCSLSKNWIASHVKCHLVVEEQGNGRLRRDLQILKKSIKPSEFATWMTGISILNLYGRTRNDSRFFWPGIFRDSYKQDRNYDKYQRIQNISARNEMQQNHIMCPLVFDIWGINFMTISCLFWLLVYNSCCGLCVQMDRG